MASFKFEGLDAYVARLEDLTLNADAMIGKAVYDGAGVVADAVRASIEALPDVEDGVGAYAYKKGTGVPLTKSAKQGLLDGFGVAPMQNENGFLHVKLGFVGYNALKTRKFPKGQPNLLVARSLENGSSIAKRHAFIKPAVQATKSQCERRMAQTLDEEIEKLTK